MEYESTSSKIESLRKANDAAFKWMSTSLAVMSHNNSTAHNALVSSFEAQREITSVDNEISRTAQALDSAEHTACMLGLHLRTARHHNSSSQELEEIQGSIEAAEEDAARYERELKELKVQRETLVAKAKSKSSTTSYLPLPLPPAGLNIPVDALVHDRSHVFFGHHGHGHNPSNGDRQRQDNGNHPGHSHSNSNSYSSSEHDSDTTETHVSIYPHAHVLAVSGESSMPRSG